MTLSSLSERIGGVEVKFGIFLISISDEDTWSAVVSAFTREKDPGGFITVKACLNLEPQTVPYLS
jgi:hypothetical protein